VILLLSGIIALAVFFGGSHNQNAAAKPTIGQQAGTHSKPFYLQQVSGPLVHIIANTHSGQAVIEEDTLTPTPWGSPTPTQESNNPAATATSFPLLIVDVQADFYTNLDDSHTFNIGPSLTPATLVFHQAFPLIDFNPPAVANVPCVPTSVANPYITPFVDVILGTPGGPCTYQTAGAVVAQTPIIPAEGTLGNFHAAFTGQLQVSQAGSVTFNFFSDDGWLLGVGPQLYVAGTPGQPTYTAGASNPAWPPTGTPRPRSAFQQYLLVGRDDYAHGPGISQVTVSFPAAGYYPFEIDYTECCLSQRSLLFGTTAGNPIPPGPSVTPTATVTPTPTHAVTCAAGGDWCTSSNPNPNVVNRLNGVVVVTNNNIWAVGATGNANLQNSLVENWNGSAWSIATVTPVGELNAIARVRAALPNTELWTVGSNGTLHYANSTWTPYLNVTGMNAVVAPSANVVFAVGNAIRRWDGTAWSNPTPIPTPASDFPIGPATLRGGTAFSSDNAWAVGSIGTMPNRKALIVHWNGTAWQVQSNLPTLTDGYLTSIDAFSTTNIWAVGAQYYRSGGDNEGYETVTLHWNGTNWQRIPSPNAAIAFNELRAVWYNEQADLWAAGTYSAVLAGTSQHTFLLHWNDNAWQPALSPDLGVSSELNGIGTAAGAPAFVTPLPAGSGNPIAPNSIWAVGRFQDSGTPEAGSGALVEQIIAPSPPPHTTSYYEHTVDPITHHTQGCLAAQHGESGIIVLDYGEPLYQEAGLPGYGTLLIPQTNSDSFTPAKLSSIQMAAQEFIRGYYDAFYNTTQCPAVPQVLDRPVTGITVALGINNSSYHNAPTATETYIPADLSAGHAQAWATMVTNANNYVAQLKVTSTPVSLPVKVAAAIDFEPDFSNLPNRTSTPFALVAAWPTAYSGTGASPYYNFGSTDGYPDLAPSEATPVVPPPYGCCSAWRVDQFYQISELILAAHALPEIYHQVSAREWYRIKRWGATQGYNYTFAGVMTQCAEYDCHSPDYNWTQAWHALWLQFNGDGAIRQSPGVTTDIR